jgi:hypothetical protein
MSATSAAVSLSSSSSVAGQQSPASKASSGYEESSLYSSPDNDWDMQGTEHVQNDVIEYYPSDSPPQTPGLSWDSRPSSASLSTPAFKSVFDETEDIVPISANLAVIIEEDGAQTVLIPADNPFFNIPSPRQPFGFAPFSTDLLAENEAEMPSNLPSAVAPHKINETAPSNAGSPDHQRVNFKNLTLLVDATFLDSTFDGEVMISSPVFSTPSIRFGDDASWAPKDFMSGPDVPLDCIYTAGDISPMAEHWGGAWSPIVRGPFRSAPCV